MGKYLARGYGVRTERSEVRAPLTKSILSYDQFGDKCSRSFNTRGRTLL